MFAKNCETEDSFSSSTGSEKAYVRKEVLKGIQSLDEATILAWRAEREGQQQRHNARGWKQLTDCIDSGKAFREGEDGKRKVTKQFAQLYWEHGMPTGTHLNVKDVIEKKYADLRIEADMRGLVHLRCMRLDECTFGGVYWPSELHV